MGRAWPRPFFLRLSYVLPVARAPRVPARRPPSLLKPVWCNQTGRQWLSLPSSWMASPPRSPFAASTVRYDAGGSSGDGLTYRVDFGDGTLVSQPSETHVYGAPGAYSVTLTVTDQTGRMQPHRSPWS